jgi:hypothetical protein
MERFGCAAHSGAAGARGFLCEQLTVKENNNNPITHDQPTDDRRRLEGGFERPPDWGGTDRLIKKSFLLSARLDTQALCFALNYFEGR